MLGALERVPVQTMALVVVWVSSTSALDSNMEISKKIGRCLKSLRVCSVGIGRQALPKLVHTAN